MTEPRMERHRHFPWKSLAFAITVALPAAMIAFLCTMFLFTYTGPQYDVVIVNDHVIGGTFDEAVAIALGTVFGAIAVFLLLTFRGDLVDWSEGKPTSN